MYKHPFIETFTDMGLPEGQTRDGQWNTNNWVEAAFKVFNVVFLDGRSNKRYGCGLLLSLSLSPHVADLYA